MPGKKKNPNNRRKHIKNASLKKQYNSKVRQEYLDYDYLDKLSPEEMEWLANFTEEYNNANFQHKGKKLIKGKKRRKVIFDQNNARNRCQFGQAKATKTLDPSPDYEALIDNEHISNNVTEDTMIRYLDAKVDAEQSSDTSDDTKKKSKNTKKL